MRDKQILLLGLFFFLLSLSGCEIQGIYNYTKLKNGETMEKLNPKSLLSKKSIDTDTLKISAIWKTLPEGEIFVYEKKDLEKGTIETISGNRKRGFIARERSLKDDVQVYKEFFPTGELKVVGKQYIGESLDSSDFDRDARREIFRVGVWIEYDNKGNTLGEVNYDEIFQFNLDDVKEMLAEEKLILFPHPQSINRKINEDKGVWIVRIKSSNPQYHFQDIYIDGLSGKVTYGRFFVVQK